MESAELKEKLVDYTQNAHAMERKVKMMLGSMISTTEDPEIKRILEHHHEETQRHEKLLAERLEAMGEGTSTTKDVVAIGGAALKGLVDAARRDKPGRNARDGYVTEHLEIASYELLERLALRAGDQATAEVAKRNCADERAMAEKIEQNWEKFLELSLQEEKVAT
jgi:ferritin-like metal-binding protein YciE